MKLFLIFMSLTTLLYSAIEDLESKNIETAEIRDLFLEPLFVSLGSSCEPAHLLRECGIRKAAFPFDWIISFDGEKIIELLEDDFLHFFNSSDLIPYDYSKALLHMQYHLEFLHDGLWEQNQYMPLFEKLRLKYQRRIDRFRQLDHFSGEIFFLRFACIHSTTADPVRYFKNGDNLEITKNYSMRLYGALKKRFPHLHFHLIIANIHDREEVEIEEFSDKLIMIRANPTLDWNLRIHLFKQFFNSLFIEDPKPSVNHIHD